MKKILFVEDDKLLRDLYGMFLASARDQWQASLAADAASALKLLSVSTFDVVASDMNMPGMGGIDLLNEVRKLYPKISRIIISGLSDHAKAADSLKCTHQFISKPVNGKTLLALLARIHSLDAYLENDALRTLASKMRSMPSFPTRYLELLREIESPTSSIESITEIISQDPGIMAKVLQVSNSAAMGISERVSDPGVAVQLLGMNTVRSLVLSAQVYGSYAPGRLRGFSPEALWTHLMKTAKLARAILRRERAEAAEVEDAYMAGMLHDMGKLMLADGVPEEFGRALALAEQKQIPLAKAEMEIFGATHAGLAAYLLGLWGLPASVVEAVAFHETPNKSDFRKCSALTAVHVANSLCDRTGMEKLNTAYLSDIGVAGRVNGWRDLTREQ